MNEHTRFDPNGPSDRATAKGYYDNTLGVAGVLQSNIATSARVMGSPKGVRWKVCHRTENGSLHSTREVVHRHTSSRTICVRVAGRTP